MTDSLREMIARAQHTEWPVEGYEAVPLDEIFPTPRSRYIFLENTYLGRADAALAAIEASGTHCVVPIADYRRLVDASEADDTIVRCEVCGAWLDHDDPATAMLDDFTGCWKTASRSEEHAHLCRSYRALDPESAARPR